MRCLYIVAPVLLCAAILAMQLHIRSCIRPNGFGVNAGYYLSGDGVWAGQMQPAAASADGDTGLVPAPKAGQHNSYLRGDGKWIQANNAPTIAQYLFAKNTDKQGPLGNDPTPVYLSFPIENTLTVGIAATHTDPKTFTILPGYSYKITAAIPLTTTPNSDFDWVGIYVNGVSQGIRGTGVPASNSNAIGDFFTVCYVTPTAPSRVQVGYIGTYGATVYYVWCTIEIISNNNTILPFTGATSAADGAIGYIPAPLSGQQNYVLTGGGNWAAISNYLSPVNVSGRNSVSFINIPDRTTEIAIIFKGISVPFNTTDFVVQLGYGSGPTYATNDYTGNASVTWSGISTAVYKTGFGIWTNQNFTAFAGVMTIRLLDTKSNTWVSSLIGTAIFSVPNLPYSTVSSGNISLSGPLTAVRIMASASTPAVTFDGGIINVKYTT